MEISEPTCMVCGRLIKYPTGQTVIGKIKICDCKGKLKPEEYMF